MAPVQRRPVLASPRTASAGRHRQLREGRDVEQSEAQAPEAPGTPATHCRSRRRSHRSGAPAHDGGCRCGSCCQWLLRRPLRERGTACQPGRSTRGSLPRVSLDSRSEIDTGTVTEPVTAWFLRLASRDERRLDEQIEPPTDDPRLPAGCRSSERPPTLSSRRPAGLQSIPVTVVARHGH